MSSGNSRQRLFRAVRLLPEAVKVGSPVQKDDPESGKKGPASGEEESGEQAAALRAEKERLELQEKLHTMEETLEGARKHTASLEQEIVKQRKDADARLEKLKADVESRLAEEKEGARQAGHDEGYSEGYSRGRDKAFQEVREEYAERFASLAEQIDGVYDELRQNLEELTEANQSRLIRLWSVVLERLLHREVDLNEATVMTLLRQVLLRVSDRERLVVYLHPQDVVSVRERRDEFADILRGIRHVEFIGDENVDRGSCLVETNLGVYDARWRTQLEQISREVDGVLLEGLSPDGDPSVSGRNGPTKGDGE